MKKNLIALSVAAMVGGLGLSSGARADVVAGAATGFQFTGDGIGHALLVPYYTAQNGNMTIFSIINTDDSIGKAVKVRFRGASNSDDVFDFTVFMSPGDVFTGAVKAGASGPEFVTDDKSCTLPATLNGEAFVLDRLSTAEKVGGAGAKEGYIEIFTMADIPKGETSFRGNTVAADVNGDGDTADENALYTAIKHSSGTAPCGLDTGRLATLLGSVTDSVATDSASPQAGTLTASAHVKGMDFPTASLAGGWTIINVDEALSYSGMSTTLVATNNGAGGVTVAMPANIVYWPQRAIVVGGTTEAALAADIGGAPNINAFSADPLLKLGGDGSNARLALGGVSPQSFDLPDMSTPYIVYDAARVAGSAAAGAAVGFAIAPWEQAAILSGALAVTTASNEFATDPSVSAASDWTFSMPSRRYNVAVRYAGDHAPAMVFTDLADGHYTDNDVIDGTLDAFDDADFTGFVAADQFFAPNGANAVSLVGEQVCVINQALSTRDREESQTTSSTEFVISPGTPGEKPSICGEAAVISVNAGSASAASVLGAKLARKDIDFNFTNGWGTFALTGGGAGNGGLPLIGSFFLKAVNPLTAAGVSANYGASWPHRVTR